MVNKSSKLILTIILAAFFFRGLFLVAIFPIFKGQDESRHYNTIQYLETNKAQNCQSHEKGNKQDKQSIATYRYSDEIRETALLSQTQQTRGKSYNKIKFSNSVNGLGEQDFKKSVHSKTQHICPPDVARNALISDDFSLYHKSLVGIESWLKTQNIFIRYYFLRIISVFLGVIVLLLAYNIFRAVNFSDRQSLILTTIISFQPKLSIYFTNINYDALLIPLWTIFVLLGILILKKGWNLWRTIALFTILWLAILTKPSALAMLGIVIYLLIYKVYQEIKKRNKKGKIKTWQILLVIGTVFFIGFLIYPLLKKVGIFNLTTDRYTQSIGVYIGKSFSKIYGSSRDYWGSLGWRANNLTIWYVRIIWLVEYIAWGGLIIFTFDAIFGRIFKSGVSRLQWKFFRKLTIGHRKKRESKRGTLATFVVGRIKNSEKYFKKMETVVKLINRQKQYLWFFLVSILVLQIGIHIADWKVFVETGSLTLGTPGRYWLPNIVPHFVLLALGLKIVTGFFESKQLRRKYFDLSLLALMVLMILYWSYEVFDIIIPRFYL